MEHALRTDIRRAATWSLALSALMIVTGLLAIGIPMIAGVAVTLIVGWLLIASAALHFVFAWRSGHASAVIWEILLGLAYAVIGFYVLSNPAVGLASLTFAVAAYLFIEGILEFVLAFQIRPAPGSGWLLVDGVITLVLAVMIWSTWPSSATWVVGTLVGISMLFSGVTRLMLSLAVRRILA
ncbi:MAG TPA: DUF308 domain-containing protein [Vicinamibacterales bacterium]|jgi:uncharacterized membrane protein HdeD (DUF308 family)|nr:DUF308 domain-containing protein [Vicinamibacterales bacterium]